MNRLLWALQAVLAVVYLAHGWMLLFPPATMVNMINASIGPRFRVFIGVAEVLASVGLIVPGLTHILAWLTPLAAAGLMIVMASATVFHVQRGEISSAIVCVVLLGLVAFVAYMRWAVHPLVSRRTVAAA